MMRWHCKASCVLELGVCYMLCFKRSVVTIVANSLFKLASAVAWISSAVKSSPPKPFLLKVAVASETRKVSNPKLPAILAVVDMQWSVVKPTITRLVIFKLSSCSFRSVPIKALFTFFLITGSLLIGFTKSLKSFPSFDSCNKDSGLDEQC